VVSAAPVVNRLHGRGRIFIVAITILKLLGTSSRNRSTGRLTAPTPWPAVWSPERLNIYNRNV
jgi:hypothetical protein